MSAKRLQNLGGMVPIVDERLLLETSAAYSENLRPQGGNLRGFRPDILVRDLTNTAAKSVYRIPNDYTESPAASFLNSTWMEFNEQSVDVLRSPVVEDSFDRYYWAQPGTEPRYNTKARITAGSASFKLGIPPPGTAPAVTASTGIPATLSEAGLGYAGTVVGGDGNLYSIPYDAQHVLIIDATTGIATQKDYGINLRGNKKWVGAVVSGNKIYCVPFNAEDILVIDTSAGTAYRSNLGATLTGTKKYFGGVLGADGKIYCIPHKATEILIIDPTGDTATTDALGATLNSNLKWAGGALGSDNQIYGIPYNSSDILIINTTMQTATLDDLGGDLVGNGKWSGGVVAGNYIYAAPLNAPDVLQINVPMQAAARLDLSLDLSANSKYSGIIKSGTDMYCVPYDAGNILHIDLSAGNGSPVGSFFTGKANLNGDAKWHGGGVLSGNLYCTPYGAKNVLVVGLAGETTERSVLGASFIDEQNKWRATINGGDGKLYGIPLNAEDILVIDPDEEVAYRTDFGADLSGTAKWASAVLGPDGKIYGIPYNATDILIFDVAMGSVTRSAMTASLTGDAKWNGAVVHGTKIYCIPYSAADILIIDTVAGTASRNAMGLTLSDTAKWAGGVLGADDMIYGIPYDAADLLIIDPSMTTAVRDDLGGDFDGLAKWYGGFARGNKIYAMPHNSSDVLVINTNTQTVDRDTLGADLFGNYKWAGAVLGPGNKGYGVPLNASDIAVIDHGGPAISRGEFDVVLSGGAKWYSGALADDDKIYCAPNDAEDILIIDPKAGEAERDDMGASLVPYEQVEEEEPETEYTRSYMCTWVSAYGEEGPPGPAVVIDGSIDDIWTLRLTPPTVGESTDRNLDKVRIYRTITSDAGVATFYFVEEVDINTANFIDDLDDEDLADQGQIESIEWVAPPEGLEGFVMLPNGVFAGWKDKEVYFSEPYRPHAWPAAYTLSVEFPIVGLGVVGQSVVVCTTGNPEVITGMHPSHMSQQKIPVFEPCANRRSIVSAPEGVSYASPNGLMFISPGGSKNITQETIDREMWLRDVDPYTIAAVRHQSSYLAVEAPRVGAGGGFLIGPGNVGFNWLSSDNAIQNIQIDPWTGEVFVIYNENVYRFDPNDGTALDPFTWKSKLFVLPKPENMAAAKVAFTTPAGTAAQNPTADHTLVQDLSADQYALLKVYADGTHVATREIRTSNALIRLPTGFKADNWQFEVTSRVIIHNIVVGTSIKELGRV